jgi:hypothetical protein
LGLGSSYKSIRSYILLSTDLPAFKTVVVMIQREETRRCGMAGSQAKNSEEHEVQALSVKCSYCRKSGHIEANCWFLHPHLRPASWIDIGDNDRKGEFDRKGEKRSGARQEKRMSAEYQNAQKGFNA